MDDEATRVPNATAPTSATDPPPWVSTAIKRGIAWAIGGVLLTLAALWFLGEETELLRYLVIAGLLSLALEPAVISMHEKRGWRRGSATGLLLVAVLLALVVVAALMADVLAREADQVIDHLPQYIDRLNDFTMDAFDTRVVSAEQRADAANASDNIRAYVAGHTEDILGGALSLVGGIFTLFTIGLFTFYLTAQGPQVRRGVLSRLPPQKTAARPLRVGDGDPQGGGLPLHQPAACWDQRVADARDAPARGGALRPSARRVRGPGRRVHPDPGHIRRGHGAGGRRPRRGGTDGRPDRLAGDRGLPADRELLPESEDQLEGARAERGGGFRRGPGGGSGGGFVGAFFALPIAATIQAVVSEYSHPYEVEDSALTRVDQRTPKPPKEDRKGLRGRLRRRKDDARSLDDAGKT